MSDSIVNALATGALAGVVIGAIVMAVKWTARGARRVADELQDNAPVIKQRLGEAAATSADGMGKLAACAGQGLRAPKQAMSESDGPRISKYEQLEKIAALKDAGILTEEDFRTEKSRILGP
jgi:hypothetical protein